MARTTLLALLVVLLPAASALVLGLYAPLRRRGTVAGVLSSLVALTTLVLSLVILATVWGQASPPVVWVVRWLPVAGKTLAEIGIRVDGTSALMLVVVALVASMVQVYSIGYLHGEPEPSLGRYFVFQSLFVVAMQTLVLAPNLLQFFLGWELVGLCSYLLIGHYYQKPSAGRAAVKAFWVNKFGDVGFLVAIILVHDQYGTWDVGALQAAVGPGTMTALVPLLLFAGVMSKSAQFPLHVWLPDAMEGPTPVSALLHAATMVAAGVYLLVRFAFLFAANATAMEVILYVGAFTALFAAVVATTQTDIKKVLAYSTCSQLGYMVAAVGASGVMASYFHLFTHAFFKALLFLAAGSIIHAVHSNELADMGGLRRKMPWTAALFGLGTLALAGIPPFAGFFSKDLVLEQLHGHPVALVAGLVTAGLTAYYMGKAFSLAFLGEPRGGHAHHAHESGWILRGPLVVLGVLAAGAGFMFHGFSVTMGLTPKPFHVGIVGLSALGLAVLGLVVAWGFHGGGGWNVAAVAGVLRPVRDFIRAGWVDRFWEVGYRRVLLVLAAVIGWLDRYVVDGLMNVLGWVTLESGSRVRVLQTGKVPDYISAVLVGLIGLAVWGYLGG
jgi:NADH-quinone oxidoreductase subunit L